jgi:hypothetical protein
MADQKINDIAAAGAAADNMQLETDIGGATPNKITVAQLKTAIGFTRSAGEVSFKTAADNLNFGTGGIKDANISTAILFGSSNNNTVYGSISDKTFVGGINESAKRAEIVNGTILQTISLAITSNGTVITASLSAVVGTTLTFVFSDGLTDVDVTAPKTATLTAGTDTVPQENWLYVLKSDPTTLVVSTTAFPDDTTTEYAPIGRVIVQTAATVLADGVLKQHNYTDHIKQDGNIGHLHDINEWIREQWSTWINGVAPTITGSGSGTVTYATTSGIVRQLHEQAFPAFVNPADIYVINDSVTPYNKITNIGGGILTDSLGGTLTNRYYNLVIWGVASKAGSGESKLFINVPSGSYATQTGAVQDANRYTNFSIPTKYKGTGFLIQRILMRNQAGTTFTSVSTEDLRGQFPNTVAGTSVATPTFFADNTFSIFNNADNTKVFDFDASGITTATTRTYKMPDNDGTFVLLEGVSGGQTIIGGTAASNNLTFQSTSHGTKGVIQLQDVVTITSPADTTNALIITANSLTTANALNLTGIDALTTGGIIRAVSDSADVTVRSLIHIQNDNVAAVGCVPLTITQDSTGNGVSITKTTSGQALLLTGSINSASDLKGLAISVTNAGTGEAVAITTTGGRLIHTLTTSNHDLLGLFETTGSAATGDDVVVACNYIASVGRTSGFTTVHRTAITPHASDTSGHTYVNYFADVSAVGASTKAAFVCSTNYDACLLAESGDIIFDAYNVEIYGDRSTDGVGFTVTIKGGNAFDSGAVDRDGGDLILKGGDAANAGVVGDVVISQGNLLLGTRKATTTYVPVNGPDLCNKTYVDAQVGGENHWDRDGTNNAVYPHTAGDDVYVGAADAYYFGVPNVNDTWRIVRSGNNLVIERRETGAYVTKSTILA